MFTYSDFVSFVKTDGLSRQNRFYITISPFKNTGPSAALFGVGSGDAKRNLHMLCKSVNLPGVNVATSQVRYTGEVIEVPYDRTFGALTMTFYVDRQMIVRKFFEDWINSIQNTKTRSMGYYDEYVSKTVIITVVDKQDNTTFDFILYDVHPKSIGNLSLDQGNNDVMTLDVEFDYHYYETIASQGKAGAQGIDALKTLRDNGFEAAQQLLAGQEIFKRLPDGLSTFTGLGATAGTLNGSPLLGGAFGNIPLLGTPPLTAIQGLDSLGNIQQLIGTTGSQLMAANGLIPNVSGMQSTANSLLGSLGLPPNPLATGPLAPIGSFLSQAAGKMGLVGTQVNGQTSTGSFSDTVGSILTNVGGTVTSISGTLANAGSLMNSIDAIGRTLGVNLIGNGTKTTFNKASSILSTSGQLIGQTSSLNTTIQNMGAISTSNGAILQNTSAVLNSANTALNIAKKLKGGGP